MPTADSGTADEKLRMRYPTPTSSELCPETTEADTDYLNM
jgi:hypothetical protein